MVVGLVSEDSVVVSTVDVAVGLGVGFFVGLGVGFFVGVALGFAVGVGDGTVSDGVSEVAVVPDVVVVAALAVFGFAAGNQGFHAERAGGLAEHAVNH